MARVWYCATCGYEVHSRGRCHSCRQKLVPSAIPELEPGVEEDEVGYRIDGWADRDRGQLIVRMNDLGIEHRFEEDELIIDAADEERVDDLVAMLSETMDAGSAAAADTGEDGDGPGDHLDAADLWTAAGRDDAARPLGDDLAASVPLDGDETAEGRVDADDGSDTWIDEGDDMAATLRLLADAVTRLRVDPTDMQADADVAEASTAVFLADRYGPFDEEAWSAIGRVTRRLLTALGADEALEEDIRKEAGVLEKLLAPLGVGAGGDSPAPAARPGERTVYELAGWRPDQRAELSIMLDQKGIAHEWEGDEILVPSSREDEVEALFDLIGGDADGADDQSDEDRYRAVAELFAACGRLSADPTDDMRRDATLRWIEETEGPPLLGLDEVDWFRIRSRARSLAAAIEGGHDPNEVFEHADQLHNLLRAVV